MIESFLLVLGLIVLTLGADLLVRGASNIALRLGLSALLVGLTVVAFGTSAPELAVSLKAALNGNGGIAVGNIVGSNIFNVAAILGISALICPLVVNPNIVRRDMPVMLGASLLFVIFLSTGSGISRIEGILLFACLLIYMALSVRDGIKNQEESAESSTKPTPLYLSIGFVVIGLTMLIFGAGMFVDNAVLIARALGWSEALIGLTIVAAGTSLPELATSVVAALRRQTDIAVGNIVGSNIFNLLCIGGLTASVHPLNPSGISLLEFGIMLGTSLILLPLMRTGFRLTRPEGGILFASFLLYLWMIQP